MPGRGGGAVVADEEGTGPPPGWVYLSDAIKASLDPLRRIRAKLAMSTRTGPTVTA
jgi:hypothetical protein